jgi:hypothetical protein
MQKLKFLDVVVIIHNFLLIFGAAGLIIADAINFEGSLGIFLNLHVKWFSNGF